MASVKGPTRHSSCTLFGNEVVYFNTESDKDRCQISCQLYQVDSCKSQLIKVRELERMSLTHGFRSECQVSLELCQLIRLADTGLDFPFALLNRRHTVDGRSVTELLLIGLLPGVSASELHLTNYGDVIRLHDVDQPVLCSNGPCVTYVHNNLLHLYHLSSGRGSNKNLCWKLGLNDTQTTSQLQQRVVAALTTFKSNGGVIRGPIGRPRVTVVCLVVAMSGAARFLRASADLIMEGTGDQLSVEEMIEFKQGLFFTSYLKIATVVQLVAANCDLSRMSILMCTRHSQLLTFDDWKRPIANKKAKLPFADAGRIQTFSRARQPHAIVVSHTGAAAVVINLNTFQVLKSVTKPFVYMVSNFLPLIGSQLLMISNNNEDQAKQLCDRYFEITDFNDILQSRKTDSANETRDETAIDKTMQNKMMGVEASVSLAQSHLDHLTRTTEEISSSLRCLAVGEEPVPQHHRPPLLGSISGGSLDPNQQTKMEEPNPTPLECSEPWQKVVDKHWIVGINVTNMSHTDLWDFKLVATSSGRDMSHTGKFFSRNQRFPDSPVLQTCKRRKHDSDDDVVAPLNHVLKPDETAIVTVVFDTSLIEHYSSIKLELAVVFKRKTTHGNILTACINCTSCKLLMDDLISNNIALSQTDLDDDETLFGLAVLDAITQPLMVTLISTTTDLIDIIHICKQATQLRQHSCTPTLYWPALTKDNDHHLQGVWIEKIDLESSTRAHMCLHTRNPSQSFILIHYLHKHLPEDILIIPHKQSKPPSLLESISTELNLVKEIIRIPDDDSTVLESGLKIYRKFRKQLNQLETETDKAYVCLLNSQISC